MNAGLQTGDEIRIIAPSSSWIRDRGKAYQRAVKRLESLGYTVSFSKNFKESDLLGSAAPQKRADDLHHAFRDKNVTAVMALNGGWAANSLLPLIDWELIKRNPKPLVGYSDITVLLNAIYTKTGTVGYLEPNLGTLGYNHGVAYTKLALQRVLTQEKPLLLAPSEKWRSGSRRKTGRTAWKVIQKGSASGRILGGNLGTLYLLQGTEYMPRFAQPTVLFIEDDDESGIYTGKEFERRLESILQQPGARASITGLVIGRFQPTSKVSYNDLKTIVASKKLSGIPVVSGIDFGHTVPMLTIPVGGSAKLIAGNEVNLEIEDY